MEIDLYTIILSGAVGCGFLGLIVLDYGWRWRALGFFMVACLLSLVALGTLYVWPYLVSDQIKAIVAGVLAVASFLLAVAVFVAIKLEITSLQDKPR